MKGRPPHLVSSEEAADILGVTLRHFRRIRNQTEVSLRVYRIVGRKLFFLRRDVLSIQKNRTARCRFPGEVKLPQGKIAKLITVPNELLERRSI